MKQNTYTCPMHPDIQQSASGMCPECGMQLVPVKQKAASHNDHQPRDKHEGHTPNVFRRKFWISFICFVNC